MVDTSLARVVTKLTARFCSAGIQTDRKTGSQQATHMILMEFHHSRYRADIHHRARMTLPPFRCLVQQSKTGHCYEEDGRKVCREVIGPLFKGLGVEESLSKRLC